MKKIALLLMTLLLIFATLSQSFCVFAATKKIITIGDSITAGSCSGNSIGSVDTNRHYQAHLKKYAGNSYTVVNYGVSGLPVLPDPVYLAKKDYDVGMGALNNSKVKAALKSNPDIVLIMLGTNDSKITKDGKIGVWEAPTGGEENFHAAFRSLVLQFRDLPCNPQVYIMLPPPALPDGFKLTTEKTARGGYRINNDIQEKYIIPIELDVADELGVDVIDVRGAFPNPQNGFGKNQLSQYLMDAVHPNALGYELLGKTVAKALGFSVNSVSPAPSTPAGGAAGETTNSGENGIKYTVTYDLQDGYSAVSPNARFSAGETATIHNGDGITKEGFKLVGWVTDPMHQSADYTLGQTFTFQKGNLLLYALWEPAKQFSITLKSYPEEVFTQTEQTYYSGDTVYLKTDNAPEFDGTLWRFLGWRFDDSEELLSEYEFVMPEENLTLTAVFEKTEDSTDGANDSTHFDVPAVPPSESAPDTTNPAEDSINHPDNSFSYNLIYALVISSVLFVCFSLTVIRLKLQKRRTANTKLEDSKQDHA